MEENRKKALAAALGQIEKQFGKGSVMRLGDAGANYDVEVSVHRLARARHRARHRRLAARPRRRDLRSGIFGQNHADAAGHRRSAARRRHRCVRRRRARARSRLRREARRERARPAGLAAGHRRAGARDHRHAGALRRGRHRRRRLGRGADAEGGNRRRDGRHARRPAGAPHVAGAAQAHRQHQALEHHRHLHQPDPHEDRRDVRQPGDHHRRQRAQVLRLGAPGHPPHRRASRTARKSSATRPASRS